MRPTTERTMMNSISDKNSSNRLRKRNSQRLDGIENEERGGKANSKPASLTDYNGDHNGRGQKSMEEGETSSQERTPHFFRVFVESLEQTEDAERDRPNLHAISDDESPQGGGTWRGASGSSSKVIHTSVKGYNNNIRSIESQGRQNESRFIHHQGRKSIIRWVFGCSAHPERDKPRSNIQNDKAEIWERQYHLTLEWISLALPSKASGLQGGPHPPGGDNQKDTLQQYEIRLILDGKVIHTDVIQSHILGGGKQKSLKHLLGSPASRSLRDLFTYSNNTKSPSSTEKSFPIRPDDANTTKEHFLHTFSILRSSQQQELNDPMLCRIAIRVPVECFESHEAAAKGCTLTFQAIGDSEENTETFLFQDLPPNLPSRNHNELHSTSEEASPPPSGRKGSMRTMFVSKLSARNIFSGASPGRASSRSRSRPKSRVKSRTNDLPDEHGAKHNVTSATSLYSQNSSGKHTSPINGDTFEEEPVSSRRSSSTSPLSGEKKRSGSKRNLMSRFPSKSNVHKHDPSSGSTAQSSRASLSQRSDQSKRHVTPSNEERVSRLPSKQRPESFASRDKDDRIRSRVGRTADEKLVDKFAKVNSKGGNRPSLMFAMTDTTTTKKAGDNERRYKMSSLNARQYHSEPHQTKSIPPATQSSAKASTTMGSVSEKDDDPESNVTDLPARKHPEKGKSIRSATLCDNAHDRQLPATLSSEERRIQDRIEATLGPSTGNQPEVNNDEEKKPPKLKKSVLKLMRVLAFTSRAGYSNNDQGENNVKKEEPGLTSAHLPDSTSPTQPDASSPRTMDPLSTEHHHNVGTPSNGSFRKLKSKKSLHKYLSDTGAKGNKEGGSLGSGAKGRRRANKDRSHGEEKTSPSLSPSQPQARFYVSRSDEDEEDLSVGHSRGNNNADPTRSRSRSSRKVKVEKSASKSSPNSRRRSSNGRQGSETSVDALDADGDMPGVEKKYTARQALGGQERRKKENCHRHRPSIESVRDLLSPTEERKQTDIPTDYFDRPSESKPMPRRNSAGDDKKDGLASRSLKSGALHRRRPAPNLLQKTRSEASILSTGEQVRGGTPSRVSSRDGDGHSVGSSQLSLEDGDGTRSRNSESGARSTGTGSTRSSAGTTKVRNFSRHKTGTSTRTQLKANAKGACSLSGNGSSRHSDNSKDRKVDLQVIKDTSVPPRNNKRVSSTERSSRSEKEGRGRPKRETRPVRKSRLDPGNRNVSGGKVATPTSRSELPALAEDYTSDLPTEKNIISERRKKGKKKTNHSNWSPTAPLNSSVESSYSGGSALEKILKHSTMSNASEDENEDDDSTVNSLKDGLFFLQHSTRRALETSTNTFDDFSLGGDGSSHVSGSASVNTSSSNSQVLDALRLMNGPMGRSVDTDASPSALLFLDDRNSSDEDMEITNVNPSTRGPNDSENHSGGSRKTTNLKTSKTSSSLCPVAEFNDLKV